MSKILKLITHAFNTHPILANSLIYGTLFVGAEFSQQTVTKKILAKEPLPYDTSTLGRCTVYGTAVQGPILTIWYKWLDKRFVGTSFKIIAKKLILDQFLFTPNLLIIFYVAMSVMERKRDLFDECKRKLVPTFQNSCMFWLPVQTLNFVLVPAKFRVVYVGTCSFAWINILCWMKRQD